jgi:hypothetical protein
VNGDTQCIEAAVIGVAIVAFALFSGGPRGIPEMREFPCEYLHKHATHGADRPTWFTVLIFA